MGNKKVNAVVFEKSPGTHFLLNQPLQVWPLVLAIR